MSTTLLNYVLYQAGWLACVLGAAWRWPQAGALVGLACLAAHVALARRRRDEIALAAAAVATGAIVDTLQIRLGTLAFPTGAIVAWLPPPWLLVIWAQFANTMHFSMRWLLGRPRTAAAFGALGGPLAFWAGQRLGAVDLDPRLWPSLLVLAFLWSLALPLLVRLAARQAGRPGAGEYRSLGRPRSP